MLGQLRIYGQLKTKLLFLDAIEVAFIYIGHRVFCNRIDTRAVIRQIIRRSLFRCLQIIFKWRAGAHQIAITVHIVDACNGWPVFAAAIALEWKKGLFF